MLSQIAGISMFSMQGIKIPNYIAKEIDSANKGSFFLRTICNQIIITAPFFWYRGKSVRPKCEGDLGIRKI